MEFKVKCIEPNSSGHRANFHLKMNKIYTVTAIFRLAHNKLGFKIKEMDERNHRDPLQRFYGFNARRFVPVDKIDISLPDDIPSIDL